MAAGVTLPCPQKHKLLPAETLHPFIGTAVSTHIGENVGARALCSNMDNSIQAKSAQSENASKTLKKLPSGPGKHVIFQTTHSISVFLSTNLALCPSLPPPPPAPRLTPFLTPSPFTLSMALSLEKPCLHFSLYLIFHIICRTYRIFVVIYAIAILPLTLEKAITFPSALADSAKSTVCEFCHNPCA